MKEFSKEANPWKLMSLQSLAKLSRWESSRQCILLWCRLMWTTFIALSQDWQLFGTFFGNVYVGGRRSSLLISFHFLNYTASISAVSSFALGSKLSSYRSKLAFCSARKFGVAISLSWWVAQLCWWSLMKWRRFYDIRRATLGGLLLESRWERSLLASTWLETTT